MGTFRQVQNSYKQHFLQIVGHTIVHPGRVTHYILHPGDGQRGRGPRRTRDQTSLARRISQLVTMVPGTRPWPRIRCAPKGGLCHGRSGNPSSQLRSSQNTMGTQNLVSDAGRGPTRPTCGRREQI